MKCTLMHKRIAVAEISIDDEIGCINDVIEVYEPLHVPIGVSVENGLVDRAELNDWWDKRSVMVGREGVKETLERLNISNTQLMIQCYGLSLSDQYWICPKGIRKTWDELNCFHNTFSEDVGNALLGKDEGKTSLDFHSPDSTTDGYLKKQWTIIDGKRCLVKGGSNPFRQQPFNEVIATGIMERLGIPHIPYTVMWNQGAPYSVCEDFITGDTELIPAWRIMQIQKQNNSTSRYQHFIKCCDVLGIQDVIPYLDQMIVLDYIIANEDRHLNNFGVIRDAETLEWIGMAPIYDSGSSLGYDKLANQIRSGKDIICKPFKKHHEEQLKLVSSFDWLDTDKLSDVGDLIAEIFSMGDAADYMDEARVSAIADTVRKRIRQVEELAMTHTEAEVMSTEDDVEENVAESYGPQM